METGKLINRELRVKEDTTESLMGSMIDSSFQDTCRICLEFGEEEDHKRKT
ncbi:hypothetical protein YC2023_026831 [Brassica napus]